MWQKYNCYANTTMKYTTLTQNVDVNKITKYDCKYCISDRGKYECLKLKGDTTTVLRQIQLWKNVIIT